MCDNTVMQYVPSGWDYKAVPGKCGNTSRDGGTLLCDNCAAKLEARYPHGWRHTPGDTCKHGTYVGDAYGPDYMCGQCESGDDEDPEESAQYFAATKRAVRAFNRILASKRPGWDEVEACDAHFDGGEWSGPAHARMQEDMEETLAQDVAKRFGVAPAALLGEANRQNHLPPFHNPSRHF